MIIIISPKTPRRKAIPGMGETFRIAVELSVVGSMKVTFSAQLIIANGCVTNNARKNSVVYSSIIHL